MRLTEDAEYRAVYYATYVAVYDATYSAARDAVTVANIRTAYNLVYYAMKKEHAE